MKKIIMLFFIGVLMVSCKLSIEGLEKGCLVISNYSGNNNLEITQVYVKERASSGYVLVYDGTIADEGSYFIELNPGSYSVKVCVRNSLWGTTSYYETGYNIYKKTEHRKSIFVVFDGKGIYFE